MARGGGQYVSDDYRSNNAYWWTHCNFTACTGMLVPNCTHLVTKECACCAADKGGGMFLAASQWLVFHPGSSNISFRGNLARMHQSGNSVFTQGTKLTWEGLCPKVLMTR